MCRDLIPVGAGEAKVSRTPRPCSGIQWLFWVEMGLFHVEHDFARMGCAIFAALVVRLSSKSWGAGRGYGFVGKVLR